MQSETPFANDDWRCKKMSEIENDAAEDVSYEDNEKHVVRRRANGRATRLKILARELARSSLKKALTASPSTA